MASIVSGPFLACCAILAIAGTRKLLRPDATRAALLAIGLPHSAAVVRAIGAAEIALAVGAAVFGGPAALGVAGAYLALTAVAWRILRRAPGTACGCLGASTAPVGGAHLAVNISSALVAVAAATGSAPSTYLPEAPARAFAFVVVVGCLTYITTLVIDTRPALRVAMQRGRSR